MRRKQKQDDYGERGEVGEFEFENEVRKAVEQYWWWQNEENDDECETKDGKPSRDERGYDGFGGGRQ